MTRHLVWDWNGTLLDDVTVCVATINVLLRRRRMPPVDRERYRAVFGFPVRAYYDALGFDFGREDWHRVAVEYYAVYRDLAARAPLRRGAREALAVFAGQGIGQTLLSACEQSVLESMVGGRGIRRFFKDLFGLPDLFAQSKADRGRELLARCGAAAAAETVLIGDTVHDFEVARELGCRCVLMAGGHQSERRLKRCGCPVVAGMRELAAHVPDGGGGAGRQGAIHRGGRRRA